MSSEKGSRTKAVGSGLEALGLSSGLLRVGWESEGEGDADTAMVLDRLSRPASIEQERALLRALLAAHDAALVAHPAAAQPRALPCVNLPWCAPVAALLVLVCIFYQKALVI